MSAIVELIFATSKSKMPAARKAKITKIVKAHTPPEHKKALAKTVDQVLNKDEAGQKTDDALVAEIKAALKGTYMVTSAARLIEAAATPEQVYTLSVIDRDGALWRILEYIKKCGDDGHSISFKIDDQSFGFDGDGADKIVSMDRDVTASLLYVKIMPLTDERMDRLKTALKKEGIKFRLKKQSGSLRNAVAIRLDSEKGASSPEAGKAALKRDKAKVQVIGRDLGLYATSRTPFTQDVTNSWNGHEINVWFLE